MTKYKRKTENTQRVVVLMKKEQVGRIDNWGYAEEMSSRTATINALIEKGLEASKHETA